MIFVKKYKKDLLKSTGLFTSQNNTVISGDVADV